MPNALATATSPYLLQHRDNPVDWHPWSQAVLAKASTEQKPILLSIGYAACHWCHVMAHESFEDEAIARLMNENFVCVKVDREERPDLDHIYQSALAAMGEHGGWPLTMFLTADGTPFWGSTYFPPEARWGRPGFPDILRQIAHLYRDSPDKIRESTTAITTALNGARPSATESPVLSMDTLDQGAAWLAGIMDPITGGFPGAPKFPQATVLDFLWRGYLRTGDPATGNAVTLALDHMSQGGIYDHLGGGFSRYATDDRWLIPHFEKMLYDNALLISALTNVWRQTASPLYEARVRETVDWLLREMTAEGGGFVSSYDADSEGEEGLFYVWTQQDIEKLLGAEDARTFAAAYDVSATGNWEGRTILNRIKAPDLGDAAFEKSLGAMRKNLFQARGARVPPARDDKVLADWNGLMIAALVRASSAFNEPTWIAAAQRAFDHICRVQSDGSRLFHSALGDQAINVSFLDDYAAMAGAALTLFETTGSQEYLDRAIGWVEILETQFWDNENGGYFFSPADGEPLILRPRHAMDSAVPSGNGLASDVLARLYSLTGDDKYRQSAEKIFRAFARDQDQDVVALASLYMGYEALEAGLQIAVVGARDDPATMALAQTVDAHAPPHRVLQIVSPDGEFPQNHPAFGKYQLDGRPTAYVCIGQVCSPPITDTTVLQAALAVKNRERAS